PFITTTTCTVGRRRTTVKLLADTSALLALVIQDDRNHAAAARFARDNPQARFVMTELILAEVATRVRVRASADRAVALARDLMRSRRYEIVFVEARLLDGALDRMAKFSDKRLSLTDCASFEIIDRLGLDGAFSFDRDFRDCGFPMVP
ncbi:MAG: type II toxin-antitoxin system VapC family toxin, partial [Candidatus Binatia bacterium]